MQFFNFFLFFFFNFDKLPLIHLYLNVLPYDKSIEITIIDDFSKYNSVKAILKVYDHREVR